MSIIFTESYFKKLRMLYRGRLLLALSRLVCIVAAISILALSPAFIVLRNSEMQDMGNQQGELDSQKVKELSLVGKRVFALSEVFAATSSPRVFISEVTEKKPVGVKIVRIKYSAPSLIMVTGSARTGKDINIFKEALLKSERYLSIDVPVGALIGTEETPFTMTLTHL